MSDIGDLIDRTYREWLTPPGGYPVIAQAGASALIDATAVTIDTTWLTPEEEFLIAGGVDIENHTTSELFRVSSYNDTTKVATIVRAVGGSTAVAITEGDELRLAPKFPRINSFNALGDVIVDLHPPLYGIGTTTLTIPSSGYVDAPADMVGPQKAIATKSSEWFKVGVNFQDDFTPATDDKAIFFSGPTGATVYLTYRKEFSRPTAESDTFADLGLDEDWQRLLMVGLVSQLVGSVDIDALTEEFIAAQVPEEIQVGTGLRLRSMLQQYYGHLETQARRRLSRRSGGIVQKVGQVAW